MNNGHHPFKPSPYTSHTFESAGHMIYMCLLDSTPQLYYQLTYQVSKSRGEIPR